MKRSLNPLISCWLDSIFSIVLGMGEKESRINVFIDELESLQFLPNLNDALTKGRKKRSVCLCWLSNLFSAG